MAKRTNAPNNYEWRKKSEELLESDFQKKSYLNEEDEAQLERKKLKLQRAKLNYQKQCREFIDLWLELRGRRKQIKKKKKLN